MARIIGIDLGTTNSLCAVLEQGGPRLIPNACGNVLTPSLVGMLDDGRVVVGDAARELRLTRPDRVVACFKRLMGTDERVELCGKTFSAPELSAIVLASLKHDAEVALGEPIRDAVITVPAYFNDHQRQATRLAGQLAQLEVRRILNEPTAAALTHGFHERGAEKKVLIFDLGGGTFDVTLMEIFAGNIEIISTAGISHLGGEDFTDRIAQWVLNQDGRDLETTELQQPLRVARLHKECEAAKRALSEHAQAELRYPHPDGTLDAKAKHLTIDRTTFARLSEDLIGRLTGPVMRVLNDGRVTPEDLGEVILVGGATRMPVVREFVARALGREPVVKFDPDHVVALGAAVQAGLIADDRAVEDLVMTDVCPFTLGIEIVKHFGHDLRRGYYLPVLPRNTTIPCSKEEVVSTVQDNQSELHLTIYQGEARKVKDNLQLGELRVSGIPRGPAGQPVCVRFTYDLNGVLEVEAVVTETGARYQTVLTNHVKGLSPREVALAVARMQALKFYPRDDLANRELILFAEQVVGEISPEQRRTLEETLDRFESAMNSGDRELFAQCRQDLLIALSALDHPFHSPHEVDGDGA